MFEEKMSINYDSGSNYELSDSSEKCFNTDLKLNFDSVKQIVGESKQVMVYGWIDCYYIEVSKALKSVDSPIGKVFNSVIGDHGMSDRDKRKILETVDGSIIKQLKFDKVHEDKRDHDNSLIKTKEKYSTSRVCKAGITNLMLENLKRKQNNMELIPLIFCIEVDESFSKKDKFVGSTPKSITSKNQEQNQLITHSELRRCYKFCQEFEKSSDPLLKEIAGIARETIKFVKLTGIEDGSCCLEKIGAPWDRDDWTPAWEERLDQRRIQEDKKGNHWIEQVEIAARCIKLAAALVMKEGSILSRNSQEYENLRGDCIYQLKGSIEYGASFGLDEFKDFIENKFDPDQAQQMIEDPKFQDLFGEVIAATVPVFPGEVSEEYTKMRFECFNELSKKFGEDSFFDEGKFREVLNEKYGNALAEKMMKSPRFQAFSEAVRSISELPDLPPD